ncbi:MAG TPA: lysylphosphatidylglycerol synthase transmembrane domain-containing protein, partial [Chitinophagaceae bacterium]|nr:lysylphosphatidylglycerol synthase transmembrane domain-containing protein [Chitinophagaceae bacterium]
MKKRLITLLQYLFFISLGVFFVWLTVKDISTNDWQHIKYSLINARHWLFLPAVIMLLSSHFSRAVRWKILMEPLGYTPSTFNVFSVVMIGYLVNAGVPRLGEVVKCTLLSRYEKVRVDRLVGTIVVERAVDVICLLIVFILTLLFQGHIIGDHVSLLMGKFFQDKAGNFSLTKLALVLFPVLAIVLIFYFLLKKFGHIDIVAKIKNILKGIVHGLLSIRYIKHKGWFLFHTLLIWSLYLFSTQVGIYALQETGHLGIGAGLTTLAIGSVGMIISPGGIGAYPLFVANLIGLYGVDVKTIGMALGWMLWAFQTVVILLGGIIFTALFSLYNKKNLNSANGQQ